MSTTLSITVDPRMELLAAIQLLAGYGNLVKARDTIQSEDAGRTFSPYTDESAVQIFHAIIQEGTYSDAYPDFALRLSDPPQLTLEEPFREYTEDCVFEEGRWSFLRRPGRSQWHQTSAPSSMENPSSTIN